MNDAPDPLEAELSALRPHEVSAALRHRVGLSLVGAPSSKLRRRVWFALAGGLAAACLAVVLFQWATDRPRVDLGTSIVSTKLAPRAEEDTSPTLREYELALARSPEELDALLDRHPSMALQPDPNVPPIGAFTRSDAALHALLGED